MLRELIINIEFYRGGDGDHIYIADDSSSGCDYKVCNVDDVLLRVKEYIINNGIMEG